EVLTVGAVDVEAGPAGREDPNVASDAGLEFLGGFFAEGLEELLARFEDAPLLFAPLDGYGNAEGVPLRGVAVPSPISVGVLDEIPVRLAIIEVLGGGAQAEVHPSVAVGTTQRGLLGKGVPFPAVVEAPETLLVREFAVGFVDD